MNPCFEPNKFMEPLAAWIGCLKQQIIYKLHFFSPIICLTETAMAIQKKRIVFYGLFGSLILF